MLPGARRHYDASQPAATVVTKGGRSRVASAPWEIRPQRRATGASGAGVRARRRCAGSVTGAAHTQCRQT